jgi:hypothetical protein
LQRRAIHRRWRPCSSFREIRSRLQRIGPVRYSVRILIHPCMGDFDLIFFS